MESRERWLRLNLFGPSEEIAEASDYSERKSGYWYRGDVYYYQNTPAMRFVKNGRNKPVILVRHTGIYPSDELKKQVTVCFVPDIGVFSHHARDYVEGDELHERMRFIMLMEAREHAYESHEPYSGKDFDRTGLQDNLTSELQKKYNSYRAYSDLFGLAWPDLPAMYRDHLETMINRKLAEWNAPELLAKRERAAARKIAKSALGLT